jgi:hypothetical protein
MLKGQRHFDKVVLETEKQHHISNQVTMAQKDEGFWFNG